MNTKGKIRVLHLLQTLGLGGAEVVMVEYIKALGFANYDHYVVCFGNDGPIRGRLARLGVPVYILERLSKIRNPLMFTLSVVRLFRNIIPIIKSHDIQIIQAHLGHANQLGVVLGKLCKIPALPTVHNTMADTDRRSVWDPRVYVIKAVDACIYRVADRILAVSEEVADIVRRRHNLVRSKVTVMSNGILFNDNSTDAANLEKMFGISPNILKLIAVGRLTYQKAFEVLINAACEVLKGGMEEFTVLIAGEGEERPRLESMVNDFGLGAHVKLLGVREDVVSLVKACDIYVLPSRYEGLSIAMIEAMACRLAIIASDAPGVRCYINHEKNGMLFPVEDHKLLAETIIRLSHDDQLRINLGREARKEFERQYDMRRNIKLLDSLLRELILKRRP